MRPLASPGMDVAYGAEDVEMMSCTAPLPDIVQTSCCTAAVGKPLASALEMCPDEVLVGVFSLLEVESLVALRRTSKRVRCLVDDEQLWHDLCLRDWPFLSPAQPLDGSWIGTYKSIEELRMRSWRGRSQWVEPAGFGYMQFTSLNLTLEKRTGLMHGGGLTQNSKTLTTFVIVGQMSAGQAFHWKKSFTFHTTNYHGVLDLQSRTLTGQLDYRDPKTSWKGTFTFDLDDAYKVLASPSQ